MFTLTYYSENSIENIEFATSEELSNTFGKLCRYYPNNRSSLIFDDNGELIYVSFNTNSALMSEIF